MNIRLYARASTIGQDSSRAVPALKAFCEERSWNIAGEYVENASGASLERPLLTQLLADAQEGDVLLVESIDRLSRLENAKWQILKQNINDKGLRLVAMDLPTSWQMLDLAGNELTSGILNAVNAMLIDILATMARLDYQTREDRQTQGIARAQAAGVYKGRQKDEASRLVVAEMLAKGNKTAQILKAAEISKATFYRIRKEIEAEGSATGEQTK